MMLDLAEYVPSYPTNSLKFLESLEDKIQVPLDTAKVRLNVLVVGAGLGGLATAIALSRKGHSVTVLEQAPALGEVRFSTET